MQSETLDQTIIKAYNRDANQQIIMDGIINDDIYSKSSAKILWILWEPYDNGGWEKWDWDSRKWINDEPQNFSHLTWKNIAKITNGILYPEKENQNDLDALRSIAYINIMKYPGESTSKDPHPRLKKAYLDYSTIIHRQIEEYAPDIIIGGNTLYLLLNHFNLEYKKGNVALPQMGTAYWPKKSRLFIDANHPRILTEASCNEIISTAVNWLD